MHPLPLSGVVTPGVSRRYNPVMRRALAFLLLALTAIAPALADELRGRVVGITDGDTLTILDASRQPHTIRLAEIDAPEKRQPYGERAKQELSMIAFGKDARVVTKDRDRYGRNVARVFVADAGTEVEIDVSDAMVRGGAAWVFTRYARDPALWSLPAADQVPPWEWRRHATIPPLP
jgi:endonuclease YncB( thermonuclease family)